ncbi:MAG: spore germination protein [Clostridia bacterium]|nr:spore germination protein [Clostridia bacterium]MDD4375670.1 spore germination protein [Clostridia bacterium]
MFNDWRLKKGPKAPKTIVTKQGITIDSIKEEFTDCDDLIVREIVMDQERKFHIIAIDGLINSLLVDQNILKPLMNLIEEEKNYTYRKNITTIFKRMEMGEIPHIEMKINNDRKQIISQVLSGFVCVLDSNVSDKAITFDTKGFEKRSFTEPSNENIVKGSKESFNETLRDNTALLRRRIKSKDLKIKEFEIGENTNTKLAIVYVEGITDKNILDEIITKVKKMKLPNIISPSSFEEQLVDDNYSIFPSVQYTERVDKLTSNLLEGDVGILIDGLPIVYTAPAVFNMLFQVPEDYSSNYMMASMIRVIRYIAALISLITPAFYVAVTSFHTEMLPTELVISIINSKKGVPFSSLLEVLFILFAFEMLIEAGARLPKLIGQTMSIVGGLIVGEAAISAKFTSPAVVVIIAIAGITGFLIPNQDLSNSFRILRFTLVLLTGIAGMYGLAIGLILILYYLAKKESFGVPYLIPFTSNKLRNITKDTFLRGVSSDNQE